MLNSAPPEVGTRATEADRFDEAVASLGDFAVMLLTSRGAERGRGAAAVAQALSDIVVAVARARSRLPGDDEILGDLDFARASLARAIAARAAEGAALAPLGPALERTRELAIERTARAPVLAAALPGAPRLLVASEGTPALHLDVRLEAAPRPIVVRAFGALSPRKGVPPAEATPAQSALRRWARDALEELAVAGRMRRPREDEAWTSGRSFEARALVSLDALASLGRGASNDERLDVARVVDETLHEWSIPDPGRVFAATFALACFSGHGAGARLHVHARNLHPTTAGAVEDALALGSSPHVDDVVLSLLCEDESPALLERGLRVARRRRRVPASLAVELLEHPELRVAVAAAQACASLDPQVARAALEDALFGPAALAVHAAEALAAMHAPVAPWADRLFALTSDNFDAPATVQAARLRVLHARGRDVEPLLELCEQLPREASIELLGWLGSAVALEPLCAALGDPDWGIRERAAWSLARITGAGRELLGTIEVDEHGNPLPDPDVEPFASSDDRTRRSPPTDAAFWAEPCARAGAVDAPRLRFGRALGPGAVVDELLEPATHQGVRRVLVTELTMLPLGNVSGNASGLASRPLPLDLDDWIARQEHLLGLARNALAPDTAAGLPPSPGGRR